VLNGGWVVFAMPWLPYPLVRDPVTIIQEEGLASEPVRVDVENITPTWIQPQMVQPIASILTTLVRPTHLEITETINSHSKL